MLLVSILRELGLPSSVAPKNLLKRKYERMTRSGKVAYFLKVYKRL